MKQKWFSILFLFALFSATEPTPSFSQDSEMNITGRPPDTPIQIFGNAWRIFLDGPITSNTPNKFEAYVIQNNIPANSLVYLNSPGGNLYAGMELGRLIRKFNFSVGVGKRTIGSNARSGIDKGGCFSSCTLAYLGGVFRYLDQDSRYGVHRFSFPEPARGSVDIAQVTSSEIVSYISAMDVDPELFKLSTLAASSEIYEPNRATLEALNVINNGATRSVWTVESVDGLLYLRGERKTAISGLNKFLVYCNKGNLILHTIFSTLGRDKELLSLPSHSLTVDDKIFPLNPTTKVIENYLFNSLYRLGSREVSALRAASTVGIAVRYNSEAPVFFGYSDMSFSAGRDKFGGIMNGCRK